MSLIPSSFENDLLYLDRLLFPRSEYRTPFYKQLVSRDMKIDMKETDVAYELMVDLPGYDKSKLDVSVDNNNMLLIKAETSEIRNENNGKYHLSERTIGSQSRSLQLPKDVDASNITARYENGILQLNIPKDTIKRGTRSLKIE